MLSKNLPDAIYTYVSDSQEIDCILAYLGITQVADEITGTLVTVGGGDYTAVYLTESSKPYSIYAEWESHEYYADEVPEELDLQE